MTELLTGRKAPHGRNNMKKYLLLLILILVFSVSFIIGQADPDTVTLSDPTEDGYAEEWYGGMEYLRSPNTNYIDFWWGGGPKVCRGYVEWDISSIPDTATITNVVFKYHGHSCSSETKYIYQMSNQPSVQSDDDAGNKVIYDDAKDGHLYHSSTTFPEVGTGKEIDLGSNADGDLQIQLSLGWFAIGLSSDEGVVEDNAIYSEEYAEVNPPPTLYVEYSVPAEVNVIFFSTPF